MEHAWWKEAVVYQIYPRSFYDSTGDGLGDIKGITAKLDYIKTLGANVIWICPVYCSPMDDNGYDISDYYKIDPMFGTNEDMEELICEAGKKGIKVLMDLVVNHTSDEHPWFLEALKNPDSKYRDYYVFREGKNGNPPNNFRTYFGSGAWERVGDSDTYYFHAFGKKQPDLNWENEELREEIYQMVNYWLDKGLGGFRIDAIGNLKKEKLTEYVPADGPDGLCSASKYILNKPGIEVWLRELRDRTFRPHNSMTVAEADVPEELLSEFIGPDGFFTMVFDFSYTDIDVPGTGEWYIPTNWTVPLLKERIISSQLATQRHGHGAVYLENHDQPRSVNKYLPNEEICYESVTMLATLFMMLRGTPFIYQGQELGMTNIPMERLESYNDLASKDQYERARNAGVSHQEAMDFLFQRSRDNSRTPMQWSDAPFGGFTKGEQTWLSVNPNYKTINVEVEMEESGSILHYYRSLISLRRECEIRDIVNHGTFVPFVSEDTVIGYERHYEGRKLLVLNHFANQTTTVETTNERKKVILGNYEKAQIAGAQITLRPYESLVLLVEA